MGENIFIPELWEPNAEINLDKYSLKSDLNNFHLKNTNINMNDHIIENVKIGGMNDAVNKSFVENTIVSQIPYMTFIKKSVTFKRFKQITKTITETIENQIFNGLKSENILLFVKGEIEDKTIGSLINYSAEVSNISNNILDVIIKIKCEYILPSNLNVPLTEVNVSVYLYIIIIHQKGLTFNVQNDQSSAISNELHQPSITNDKSLDMSKSYF